MENITIFTIPKAFTGIFDTIQRNAITSWMLLEPTPEIILCGNDKGVAEFAREKDLLHIPNIEISEKGTPYLSDVFFKVHCVASNCTLMYSNCDIIFLNNFGPIIDKVNHKFSEAFLMIGQRFDVDLPQLLEFVSPGWKQDLRAKVLATGVYHSVLGIDYFIFKRGFWWYFPRFMVGRPGWDNWFVNKALQRKHAVIDVTEAVFAIHQNHDFSHLKGGQQEARFGCEAKYNTEKGKHVPIRSIADANYKMRAGADYRLHGMNTEKKGVDTKKKISMRAKKRIRVKTKKRVNVITNRGVIKRRIR